MLLIDVFSNEIGMSLAHASDSLDSYWIESGIPNTPVSTPRTQPQLIALVASKTVSSSNTRYFAHRDSLTARQYRSDLGVQLTSAPEAYATQGVVHAGRSEIQAASPRAPRGRSFIY